MRRAAVQFTRNGGAAPYAVLGRGSIFRRCCSAFREGDQKAICKHMKP